MIVHIATMDGKQYWRCRECQETWISGGNPEFEHVCQVIPFGPGTEAHKIFTAMGFEACGQCAALMQKMNEWGPTGCEEHLEAIVDDIASRTWIPLARPVIRRIIKKSIKNSLTAKV